MSFGSIESLNYLTPWVVFLPLIGLVLNLLIGKRLGGKAAGVIASIASAAAFGVSVVLALALAAAPEKVGVYHLADWLAVGKLTIGWDFRADTLSATMMLVVSGVGTLIHIYAIEYMAKDVQHNGDPGRYRRFFVYFGLFITAMMILVTANSYLMMFVGWEGVGLCSYLLIGFWFEKGAGGLGNARAAKKAFIVNRIGDFGLLVAMFMIFWWCGSLQYDAVFAKAPEMASVAPGVVLAITLCLLVGVTGKSAQLPLYIWLPDAMAGPTPVSALIHAATMVTAGVYLVARSSALFLLVPAAQSVVTWVGALTAIFAATIAVAQFDIKKVLAYSTISQLGFMVAAVGMGAYTAGMFHLVTHAFFKALLFLAAGSVIQGMERGHEALHTHGHGKESANGHEVEFDPQDMRNMGGLQPRMRVTFWVYLVGALALAGIVPLAGFFSKDEILAAALSKQPAVFVVLIAAAFLTAFYMGRQVFMVFFGHSRSEAAGKSTESPALITVPLIILAALAAFGGALNLPGVLTLEHWLEPSLKANVAEPFNLVVAAAALVLALLGIFLSWNTYSLRLMGAADPLERVLGSLFRGANARWWVDEAYHAIFVRPYQRFSIFLADTFDLGFIDSIGGGLGSLFKSLAGIGSRGETGYVRSYVLWLVLGVVAILAYLVIR
jgi:NADH-quinone oxidoreductase subunit L